MAKNFQKVVKHLISRLKEHGLIIQRYDAFSTHSIYLKLDFGVCNSIRVSDHPGYGHLSYRYNLIKGETARTVITSEGLERHFFPIDCVDKLVTKILKDRSNRLDAYGPDKYAALMKVNQNKHRNDRGFWKNARLV